MKAVASLVLFLSIALAVTAAQKASVDEAKVRAILSGGNTEQELRALGPAALPALARIYPSFPEAGRAEIANIFYSLGWKSPEAKAALMKDVHTNDQTLRIQVQWALGRVSGDEEVVDVLADIMRHDSNALFRDKAACALAEDQIHLTEPQKVRLYSKLIDALSDQEAQVRAIAIQALQIQTGQRKGFKPDSPLAERQKAIAAWKLWIAEYAENL